MYLSLKTNSPVRLMAALLVGVMSLCVWVMSVDALAVGGDEENDVDVRAVEDRLYDLRTEQAVRARRVEILRAQFDALDRAGDTEELRDARDRLTELLLDSRLAEEEILSSLHELFDAQAIAQRASRHAHDDEDVTFDWPVEPTLGISAHFDEAAYRARFGFAHKAIDIPVLHGSMVASIADGVVEKVSDQGYGFNSIVIRHAGGYASLYGHVSAFLVSEGDEVEKGDAIAKSGGTPGTKGAGKITTGAHLHLEVLQNGTHINPLPLLPAYDGAE